MKSNYIKHALILAAGRGSRMMPITDSTPKPLIPFLNTTLIGHGISQLSRSIENIHITVGYKKSVVAEYVLGLNIQSIFNTQGKGNSWVLFNTLIKNLDQPVIVLTADNVCELDIDFLESEYQRLKQPACMLVPVRKIKKIHGDFIFSEKNKILKLSRDDQAETYSSGIQIINPCKISKLIEPLDDFNHVWSELMSLNQLYCSNTYEGSWFSVDTVEHLKMLISGDYFKENIK